MEEKLAVPLKPNPISTILTESPKVDAAPVPAIPPPSKVQQFLDEKNRFLSRQNEMIQEKLEERRRIDVDLMELGYTEDVPKTPSNQSKHPCRVCGSVDHDARSHRKENLAKIGKGGNTKKK